MDNKKQIKRLGIILCIIGAVMLLSGGYIILRQNVSPSKKETTANATTDTEELVTEDSNSADDSEQNTKKQPSAHDINPDIYKWPCGNEFFDGREEPRQITEFAEYKEYYEQIAQQFLEYEGKDVNFYGNYNKFYFDECSNEGSVKISYDKELMLDLFEKSNIKAIDVYSDRIIFHTDVSNGERIMYFYDETLTYDDPLPSEKDDLISHYWMVNIAPHWWWEDSRPNK